jgi:lysophospholipase L1-like esterase
VLVLAAVGAAPAAAGGGGSTAEKPTVLVLGDSIGQGYARALERQGDFTVINAATVNCSLVTTGRLQSYNRPLTPDGSIDQACDNWRTEWAALVDQHQPDIVLAITGGWEIVNRWFGTPGVGPAATLRDKEFRDAFSDAYTEAAELLSQGGAEVVFTTSWYANPPRAQPYQEINPTVWEIWWEPYGPEEPPANWVPPIEGQEFVPSKEKIERLNKLKLKVGKKTDATTIDVNKFVSPDGEYTDTVDGVYVRAEDLSHFNEEGNDVVAEYIAPKLKKLANSND